MFRPIARILPAAALALAFGAVPALSQSPYGQYDRYHDHLWNPSNGGFAAGVANVPGVSPGGAAGSSYSQVVTYPTGTPPTSEPPPSTVTPKPNPPAPTGQWVGGLTQFLGGGDGYARWIQVVYCTGTCSTPKPATTRDGKAYADGGVCQTSDGHGSVAGFPPGGFQGYYLVPQCWLAGSF